MVHLLKRFRQCINFYVMMRNYSLTHALTQSAPDAEIDFATIS